MLSAKRVKPFLVSCTRFFLTVRSCCLIFLGSPKDFAPLSLSTPQWSPVSPLLFLIYISRLHKQIPYALTLCYMDHFTHTVSSSSYLHNVQLLQRQYAILNAKGSRLGEGLSVPKTEQIHWRTSWDGDPPSAASIHLDELVFGPKNKLRCLRL